ncbi:uncharacterized protein LOC111021118 [Momordica charantia]|uniref:Uncharacterized protein LOC111021118 n=1 Tax=Momordica charantia TaxID=3673 RepID=A0A6J1DJR2_MOMCH|nr:uncharacterized protein LOC111021118 [Momordica charantia]
MDAAEKLKPKAGLFDEILPPRLEDAGLEDCALPPDSIREAFAKAASAVKSRATSILSSDGHCVEDPRPADAGESTDVVTGISPERDPPGPCATAKGAKLPEFGGDAMVIGGGEGRGDEVVAVAGGTEKRRGQGCVVDVLQGLEIGEDAKEKDKSGGPILGEGFASNNS